MFRFQLLGVPVQVQWWFWLTACLLNMSVLTDGSSDAVGKLIAWLAAVFISVLWHEFGHALSMKGYGYRPSVVLQAFGGYATSPGFGGDSTWKQRKQDIFVSLAGPFAGLLLWGVLYSLLRTGIIPPPEGVFGLFIVYMLFANLWWSILNLLPIFPLDGGRVLFAAMGPARRRNALITTIAAGVLLVGWSLLNGGIGFFAVFVGLMTFQNFQRLQGMPPSNTFGNYGR